LTRRLVVGVLVIVPSHVLLSEFQTSSSVVGWPPAARTRTTRELVFYVRVGIARCAHPTTRVSLLNSFDMADVTRPAALRYRYIVRTYFTQQNRPPIHAIAQTTWRYNAKYTNGRSVLLDIDYLVNIYAAEKLVNNTLTFITSLLKVKTQTPS